MFLLVSPMSITKLEEINLLLLRKLFSAYEDEVVFVRRRKYDFLVKFTPSTGDLLRAAENQETISLHLRALRLSLPEDLNMLKGVITHPELDYLSARDVRDLLEDEDVKTVYKPSGTVAILGWHSSSARTSPPSTVVLGWDTVVVRPYIPRPTRCHRCQKYGHAEAVCHLPSTVCARCSSAGHSADDCTATELSCPACNGPHAATDPECPAWLKEKQITKVKFKHQLSYKDALLRVSKEVRTLDATPADLPLTTPDSRPLDSTDTDADVDITVDSEHDLPTDPPPAPPSSSKKRKKKGKANVTRLSCSTTR